MSQPRLCPGCNVLAPWEHRCTGILACDSGSMFLRSLPCECPDCKEPSTEELAEFRKTLSVPTGDDPST